MLTTDSSVTDNPNNSETISWANGDPISILNNATGGFAGIFYKDVAMTEVYAVADVTVTVVNATTIRVTFNGPEVYDNSGSLIASFS